MKKCYSYLKALSPESTIVLLALFFFLLPFLRYISTQLKTWANFTIAMHLHRFHWRKYEIESFTINSDVTRNHMALFDQEIQERYYPSTDKMNLNASVFFSDNDLRALREWLKSETFFELLHYRKLCVTYEKGFVYPMSIVAANDHYRFFTNCI